jgi:hypothetical protein
MLQVEPVALGQPAVDSHLHPHHLIHQPGGRRISGGSDTTEALRLQIPARSAQQLRT